MALKPGHLRLQLSDLIARGNTGVADGPACDSRPGPQGGEHRVTLVSPMNPDSAAERHQQALVDAGAAVCLPLRPNLPPSRQLIEVASGIPTKMPGIELVFKRDAQVCAESAIAAAYPVEVSRSLREMIGLAPSYQQYALREAGPEGLQDHDIPLQERVSSTRSEMRRRIAPVQKPDVSWVRP